MTELILIRHGETDWNRELRFQGHVDVPLNATGHEQARRLAERLAAERPVVHHLICSDLIRTRQTATPSLHVLLPEARIDTLTDSALREQNFGVVVCWVRMRSLQMRWCTTGRSAARRSARRRACSWPVALRGTSTWP